MKKRFSILLKLRKREGISLMALIAVMVMMAVTGSIFGTFMGRWKVSAPIDINSLKAFYLAETALMYALQDAKYRFFAGSPNGYADASNRGTRSSPRSLVSSSTEGATYWFELPSGNPFGASASDDETSGPEDDDVDDDNDDGTANLYTIIATGKIKRGSATVATRQIKAKATITSYTSTDLGPGVYTEGTVRGTGGGGFDIWKDGSTTHDLAYGVGDNNATYSSNPGATTLAQKESGIVYRTVPVLDGNAFKAIARDQGHYQSGSFSAPNNYPNGSFYYSGTTPNVTYVNGDLTISGSDAIYGIYYVNGSFTLNGNAEVHGIIIATGAVSNVSLNGGGGSDIEIEGGLIQYGSTSVLDGDGNPVDIKVKNSFFTDMDSALTKAVTISSWQEAVAAN